MSQSVSLGEGSSPVDALLADYACGRLAASLHTLVASHLALKPSGAAFVAKLETLHGCELEGMTAVAAADLHRHRIAAILDGKAKTVATAAAKTTAKPETARSHPASTTLPHPLYRFIGRDLPDIRWRTRLPGLKEYHIETSDGLEASLLWIGAGRKMLSHTHQGSEVTLVLQGAFEDAKGRYQRGDVAVADAEIDHAPRADADVDCICFAVTDAPLRLTGPIGRLLSKVFGH